TPPALPLSILVGCGGDQARKGNACRFSANTSARYRIARVTLRFKIKSWTTARAGVLVLNYVSTERNRRRYRGELTDARQHRDRVRDRYRAIFVYVGVLRRGGALCVVMGEHARE